MASNPHLEQRQGIADLVEFAHQEVNSVWPSLQQLPLATARSDLTDILYSAGTQYGDAAAALAAEHYESMREAAGAKGVFDPLLAEEPDVDRYRALSNWGTQGLLEDPGDPARWAVAQEKVFGGLQRSIADQHRETIVGSSVADPAAKGWARVGIGGNCEFCNMLISRGSVYKDTTVTFRSHDHCNCSAAPAFSDVINLRSLANGPGLSGATNTYVAVAAKDPYATLMDTKSSIMEYAWGIDPDNNGALTYAALNGNLRLGQALDPRQKWVQDSIDKAAREAKPLTRPMTVHRMIPDSDEELVNEILRAARSKKTWVDDGYMSTTTNEDILLDFAGSGDNDVQLDILLPKGTKAIDVDSILKDEEKAYLQQEWLLPRGSKLQLGDVSPSPEGGWIVKARLVSSSSVDMELAEPVAKAKVASTAERIARLERTIASETARGRKNPRLRKATQENIRKARIELNKLKRKK